MNQWVYKFGGGTAEGDTSMKNLLGGKGANLAEMASLGLPVPPGFTLTTDVCTYFHDHGENYPDDMDAQIETGLKHIEELTGKTFGDASNPLLVSVRSGARASMPGMMDTVLNLGLNDETVDGLAKLSGDRRFALDSYRRFITMYSDVVMGVHHHTFEDILEDAKLDNGYSQDTEMTAADWEAVIAQFKEAVRAALGRDFPQDAREQLKGAVDAVFGSWMNDRAVVYRNLNDIPAGYKRAANILRAEEKKTGSPSVIPAKRSAEPGPDVGKDAGVDTQATGPGYAGLALGRDDSFSAVEAQALAAALSAVAPKIDTALSNADYPAALSALANLREPIDAFFENVVVNSDDPDERARRLALLSAIVETFHRIADFSRLDG